MRQADVNIPLGIPDVRVLQTATNERGEIIITIESTKQGTRCRKCGKWITKSHGLDEWVTIRHLPAFGRRTYLRYRPKRYECQGCEGHPTTTEILEWHERNSPHSFAYDNQLLLQLVNSTVEDVSAKEDIGYDSVVGALERRIATKIDWTVIAEIVALGLDEISLRKGRRDYITLVTGRLANGEIILLGVLSGHEKAETVDFLRSIPPRIVEKIQAVCCDLWEAYIQAVREELSHVRIVADRFHVAKHYYEAADQERKRELKHLKETLTKQEYKMLEGSMYAFRKRHDDLNDKERKILNRFLKLAPFAKKAYELREQLTAIFDQRLSKDQAQSKILRWMKKVQECGLQCFDTFMKLLAARWEEITNYFFERENSGFVEGFNNKVKVLKRRCYGIFNLQHIFQRIYLDLTGYRLFASTPISG